MSHFSFSISFPKNKVSALIPRDSHSKPTPFPFPVVRPSSREETTSPDARTSRKPPLQPSYRRAYPTRRAMSLLEKASSTSENSSAEEKQLRRIVRKPLGRKSEGNLKAANKSKRTEEQFTTPSTFDVPPPPPPKDPIPISIPIKGKGTDNRASMKRGKILNHIPGFSDDEDDAKTFTTQSVTSDSDAASSLQTPTTPAESGSSLRSCDFSQSPYEPPFTIEREDRAIEPYNALTPPPIHRRKKSPVLRLP